MRNIYLIIIGCITLNACGNLSPVEIKNPAADSLRKPESSHPERPSVTPPAPEGTGTSKDDKVEPEQEPEPDSEQEPKRAPEPEPEQKSEKSEPEPEPAAKLPIRLSIFDVQVMLPDCIDFSNVYLDKGHIILQLESQPDTCFLINTNLIAGLQGRTIKVGDTVKVGNYRFTVLNTEA